MMSWRFLVLIVFSIWLSTGYGAQEVCDCRPTIIRTPEITVPTSVYRIICTKTHGAPKYTPIKNGCSCENTRLTPTMIARMQSAVTKQTTVGCGCGSDSEPRPYGERGGAFFPAVSTCNNAAGDASSGYPVLQEPPGPNGIDEPASGIPCGGPTSVVVDPVSLMLAQAEANRCRGSGVREDRLAFGPIVVPKDALPPSSDVPDINEEGLYALDKAIVELKTCKRFGQSSAALATDTDALLALEEDAQPIDEDAAGPEVNLPSYADVGYQTETPYCSPLISGVAVPPVSVTNSDSGESLPQHFSKISSQYKCPCGKCNKKSP